MWISQPEPRSYLEDSIGFPYFFTHPNGDGGDGDDGDDVMWPNDSQLRCPDHLQILALPALPPATRPKNFTADGWNWRMNPQSG